MEGLDIEGTDYEIVDREGRSRIDGLNSKTADLSSAESPNHYEYITNFSTEGAVGRWRASHWTSSDIAASANWNQRGEDTTSRGLGYVSVRVPKIANKSVYQLEFLTNNPSSGLTYLRLLDRYTPVFEGTVWSYYSIAVPSWVGFLGLRIASNAAHVGNTHFGGTLSVDKILSALGLSAITSINRGKWLKRKNDDTGFEYVDAPVTEVGNNSVTLAKLSAAVRSMLTSAGIVAEDVPIPGSGDAGKFLKVNDDENAYELTDPPSGEGDTTVAGLDLTQVGTTAGYNLTHVGSGGITDTVPLADLSDTFYIQPRYSRSSNDNLQWLELVRKSDITTTGYRLQLRGGGGAFVRLQSATVNGVATLRLNNTSSSSNNYSNLNFKLFNTRPSTQQQGGVAPTLANVLSALGLGAVANSNRLKWIRRKNDNTGFEYVDAPEGGGDTTDIENDITRLQTKTPDLLPGRSVLPTWTDVSSDSVGGIVIGSSGSLTVQQLAALTWSTSISGRSQGGSTILYARIATGGSAPEHRIVLKATGVQDTPIAFHEFRLVGSDDNWDYYLLAHNFGDLVTDITFQASGDDAHVGLTTYLGNLTKKKVYEMVKLIMQGGINNDTNETVTIPEVNYDNEVDDLQDKTFDIHAGGHSGEALWSNATQNTQGGLTLTSTIPTAIAGYAGSTWALSISNVATKVKAGNIYLSMRIPRGFNRVQARAYIERGSTDRGERIGSYMTLVASGTTYDYYVSRLPLTKRETAIVFSVTGDEAHIGKSTFFGNLVGNKILKALGLADLGTGNRGKWIRRKADDTGFEYADAPSGGTGGGTAPEVAPPFDITTSATRRAFSTTSGDHTIELTALATNDFLSNLSNNTVTAKKGYYSAYIQFNVYAAATGTALQLGNERYAIRLEANGTDVVELPTYNDYLRTIADAGDRDRYGNEYRGVRFYVPADDTVIDFDILLGSSGNNGHFASSKIIVIPEPAGAQGEQGAGMRVGTGVPTATATDKAGAFYVNLTNGDTYSFDGTAWTKGTLNIANATVANWAKTSNTDRIPATKAPLTIPAVNAAGMVLATKAWIGTKAQYDAITTKANDTIYYVDPS